MTVYSRRSITTETWRADDLWSFRRCVESNLLLIIKCQHLQIIPLLILRNCTVLITDMMMSALLIYILSCFLEWERKMVAYWWFLPYMGLFLYSSELKINFRTENLLLQLWKVLAIMPLYVVIRVQSLNLILVSFFVEYLYSHYLPLVHLLILNQLGLSRPLT